MKRWFAGLLLAAAGCAVGPDYQRPALPVPEQYRGTTATPVSGGASDASIGERGWWEVYTDPNLQSLLTAALQDNLDVKIAVARIDQARAAAGSTRLAYLPQVSAAAGASRTQVSDYARNPGSARVYSEDQVQIDASYQIDLWGQLRRTNEAARANLLASRYARRAVEATLVATLASAYFNLISFDSQLEITRRTVNSREKFVELTRAQKNRGYVSGLDVATAEAQLDSARANVPDLERQITQTEDEISVLLGKNPVKITRTHYGESIPTAPPRPPAGIPASLLERRPDVAQAEQGLIAANAQVGVAKAALFPNITLTGSAGSLSVPLSHLLTAPAAQWSVGAGLVQPLINVQSNLFQLQLADARKREALYAYQKAVLAAFQDVADALAAYQKYGELEQIQAAQVEELRRAHQIAFARYRIGYASYFDVINADRDLFSAELQLAQAFTADLNALVRLYAALGGGWQERPPGATPERVH